jgi:hypothetical protein
MTRGLTWLGAAVLLAACGGGTMTGTVTVQGGSAANITAFVYGPVSKAAVTNAEGRFTASGLPDGDYSVVVKVRGADVEEQALAVTMTGGAASPEPAFTFSMATGTVTGKLVFADGSDASNVSVTLAGTTSRGTRTGAGGTFSFEKVPAGAYVVSVDLVDTREKRASVGVAVSGNSQDVGELRMTLVGRIGGTVTENGAPAGGVSVAVAGTPLSAVSDALGRFDFAEVPTGDASFVATAGAQQQLSATASTRVVRGANPDLSLALGDNQARRGTVTGAVNFITTQSPTVITVSVPGTNATATPAANGSFSLMVPAGDWDVVADAPFHPQRTLGRVHVDAGGTTSLPARELSWYRDVWTTDSTLNSAVQVAASATAPWAVVRTSESAVVRSLLFNTRTNDVRVLASTSVSSPRFSVNAKYLGFVLSGELFVYELATGAMTTWGTGVGTFDFSTDEQVLFAVRAGALERIRLASGATTRFPSTGSASAISQHTSDRWFVREASNDVTLVEPTTETAQIFTQVVSLNMYPTPWATSSCATNCTLQVVAPAGRVARTVAQTSTSFSVITSPGEYPTFVSAAGLYFIVQASSGNNYPLPTGTNRVIFNPDASRYAFQTVVAGNTTVREEALPPTMSPGTVASSSFGFSFAYVSNARLVAAEAAGPHRIFDMKISGGSASTTIETDVDTTFSVVVVPPLVVWPKLSSAKWQAFIGDKATLTVNEPITTPPSSVGVRALANDGTTDYAAVSFDSTSTWVVDEKLGQVRALLGGYGYAAERSGTSDFFFWQRPGAADYVAFGPELMMGVQDPGVLNLTSLVAGGERGVLAVSTDRKRLAFGVVRP